LHAYNTDAEGFLAPLWRVFAKPALSGESAALSAADAAVPGAARLCALNAVVLGAGGAARSAVYALAREGARVVVVNRTQDRALRLCQDITAALDLAAGALTCVSPDDELPENIGLIVNSTSMGMHPHEDLDPFAGRAFRGSEIVYDMVYSPRETLFIKRAREAGCKVVYGEEMLMNQAYRQFYLYTGKSITEVKE
jgi:shikimate 5-dehydrogenase